MLLFFSMAAPCQKLFIRKPTGATQRLLPQAASLLVLPPSPCGAISCDILHVASLY
jgi:hypothetical protein